MHNMKALCDMAQAHAKSLERPFRFTFFDLGVSVRKHYNKAPNLVHAQVRGQDIRTP